VCRSGLTARAPPRQVILAQREVALCGLAQARQFTLLARRFTLVARQFTRR
jgi:hypothetical protein